MDAACSKVCALGLGLALGLMSGLTPTDAVAQEDTPVLAQIDARPAALLAEFGRASRPLLPTVLDWNDADHRAMIEGLFAAAQMSDEDRAALQEVFARAGSGTHAGIRARTPSLGDLAAEPDDYWIGPVTSVFDMENTGDTLAVNAVVSMAAPPARCFGLLGLSPNANFERVQTSVVQREFSCADLQLRVEGTSDLFAASTSQDGTPTAIAVSVAEYPDGEVHFLASTTSAVSSGGFTASSTWPPQDPPGALIKVCVYRGESDCSYTYDRSQALNFRIEGSAGFSDATEQFVPDYPVQMNALVQRTNGGGCYMFDVTRNAGNGLSITYDDQNRQIDWRADDIQMYNPDNCLTGQNAVHYYFSLQVRTAGTPLSGVQHIYVATPHYLSTAPDLLLPPMEVAWGCIAAGSLVTMADGSERAIEDIAPGDRVLSGTDAITVTELTTGLEPNPMVVLVTQAGDRLSLTRDHPVPVRDAILRADAVRAGMAVNGSQGPLVIASVAQGNTMVPVYNLKLGTPVERFEYGREGMTFLANGLSVGDYHMQTALGRAGRDTVLIGALPAE